MLMVYFLLRSLGFAGITRTFTGPWIDPRLPSWPCLMSAPPSTRSIMTSFYSAFLFLSALLANLLTGSARSYAIALPVLFPGRPGPTGPCPIWVAPRFCTGPAIIHTLHFRNRTALVFLWSPKPNLRRRHPGLRSLSCGKSGHCCPLHAACYRLPWWLDVVESTPAKPF